MEKLQIISEINRKEIMGEAISNEEKERIISILLHGINDRDEIIKYKKRMRTNVDTIYMYPNFYIPPYDNKKKYRLVQGYLPKTNILYANHYELEILRLLTMFAPKNNLVKEMITDTVQRLKHTCFGNSCTQGECLATGISVLRFLVVTRPIDKEWNY